MIHIVPKDSFPYSALARSPHHPPLPASGNGQEAQTSLTLSYLNLLLISDTCKKSYLKALIDTVLCIRC